MAKLGPSWCMSRALGIRRSLTRRRESLVIYESRETYIKMKGTSLISLFCKGPTLELLWRCMMSRRWVRHFLSFSDWIFSDKHCLQAFIVSRANMNFFFLFTYKINIIFDHSWSTCCLQICCYLRFVLQNKIYFGYVISATEMLHFHLNEFLDK